MKKQSFVIRDEAGRSRVLDVIKSVDIEKPVRVEWGPQTQRRSLSQNALMWKWHQRIAEETGHTSDEVHEFIKEMFCPPKTVAIGGEERMIRSTRLLEKSEMTELMNHYYAWACGQGWLLPVPEEMGRAA